MHLWANLGPQLALSVTKIRSPAVISAHSPTWTVKALSPTLPQCQPEFLALPCIDVELLTEPSILCLGGRHVILCHCCTCLYHAIGVKAMRVHLK